VVCQHGLEGRPQDVADRSGQSGLWPLRLQAGGTGLCDVCAQNPYIGGDKFRVLQRMLNPLKKTLFSVIVQQHDGPWSGFRGCRSWTRIASLLRLSYGGKTAMRVPALLEKYCLSICSRTTTSGLEECELRHIYCYVTTSEYEMFEFNLGNTFNYAEMSWLICPRPFMVERGHHDGVPRMNGGL